MKAKDYFARYDRIIVNDQITGTGDGAYQLLIDLLREVGEVSENRHAKSESAIGAILKEMNQKWNAICSLYEKKYGGSPLKRNGFKEFIKTKIPESNDLF